VDIEGRDLVRSRLGSSRRTSIIRALVLAEFSLSFGPFRLNPTRRVLLRDGKPLRLGSRALDLLIALVDNGKDLISKEDLLKRVWPDTFIEEANLRVHVAALRNQRNGQRRRMFALSPTWKRRLRRALPWWRLLHRSESKAVLHAEHRRVSLSVTSSGSCGNICANLFAKFGGTGMTDTTTKTLKIPSHQLVDVKRFVAEQDIADARVAPVIEQPSLSRRKPLGETHWIEIILSAATASLTKELVSRVLAFLKDQGTAETEKKPDDDAARKEPRQRDEP
jgi:hypothetical protein